VQFSATAPSHFRFTIYDLRVLFASGCASARGRVSKTPPTRGSTEAACQIVNRQSSIVNFWGRGRQVMHLPCKQGPAGALPADSTISLRENEIQARLLSSASVGDTPTPATSA
jgi:hypothetical protein